MKKRILIAAGAICLMLAAALGLSLAMPLFTREKVVSFSSTYKEEAVTLEGSIYEADGAEYGVLICPGYSCDRQKLNAVAGLFLKNGMTVMTFDYAGQGASSDTIGFDNAKSDAITEEIEDALEVFHEETGIPYENMILAGHSMGGRAILRLLYDYNSPDAVTTVEKHPLKAVILMAPEVNYLQNTQASLFAGTSDAEEEPWKSFQESWTAGLDVYLYGSTGDDIVQDEDIWAICSHLGGNPPQESGVGSWSSVNGVGSKITTAVVTGELHSFQFYSVQFAQLLNEACQGISGNEAQYPAWQFSFIYACWILSCLGAMLVVGGSSAGLKKGRVPETIPETISETIPEITDVKGFLKHKLFMWLPGIGMAFLVCCLCVVSPWGSPIMNVPYMCFIAGYGLTMLLAYRRGKFKGSLGKLPKPTLKVRRVQGPDRGIRTSPWLALGIVVLISLCGWLCLRCTVFRLFPWNFRLPWLFFAGGLMTIGYYVTGVEEDMLDRAGTGRKEKLLYGLINYIPLFLFVAFYLVIGSFSGMVQQLINVVLMVVVFEPLGEYLKKALQNRLYGALLTAFLFQGMMLTSASLIAMF